MQVFYKGTDFIGQFKIDNTAISDLVTMKVAVYTDGGTSLEFDGKAPFDKAVGGFLTVLGVMSLFIPSNRLNTLKDGQLNYDLNIGVRNDNFPDGVQNRVYSGNFGVMLKSTKVSI